MSYKENFQYTGNAVKINPTYAHTQVIHLLDEYNYQLENDIPSDLNPFNEKLIVENSDGSMYEIPDAIQKLAIKTWLKTNNSKHIVDNANTSYLHIFIYMSVIILLIVFGYLTFYKVNSIKYL